MSRSKHQKFPRKQFDALAISLSFLASVFVLLAANSNQVLAAGADWGGTEDDLQVIANYRWVGGRAGGYYPIRIRLTNRGPKRTVEVKFDSHAGSHMPTVIRTVEINQNASANFTLLIPMVSSYNHGWLNFESDGTTLDSLRHSIGLPDFDQSNSRPSLLIITNEGVNAQEFENAVSTRYGVAHGWSGSSLNADHEIVAPVLLPNNWLAYSGVDIVAIDRPSLEVISNDNRTALTQWLYAGGRLIIFNAGAEENDQSEVLNILKLADSTTGMPSRLQPRQALTQIREVDENGGESILGVNADDPSKLFRWSEDEFTLNRYGFGKLAVFGGLAFDGSAHDWNHLLAGFGMTRHSEIKGVSGRTGNKEFLHFLIPGIRTIPPIAFLIFISVFAFLIGPLNYFFLQRRGKLNFLVLSVPLVAGVTSLILFGYSAVSQGFSTKCRMRSVTILDQGTQTAVSVTRLSLYAGSAPSDGMHFSSNTAIEPIWPENSEFIYGVLDWTKDQNMRSGWLRSRTRTQFMTTMVRPERGRLAVESNSEKAEVKNGLEWDIEALFVVDKDGKYFYGKHLAAGAAQILQPAEARHEEEFENLLLRNKPGRPSELDEKVDIGMFQDFGPRARRYYYDPGTRKSHLVSLGQVEFQIRHLMLVLTPSKIEGQSTSVPLPAKTYYAIVKKAPGIEIGVEEAEELASWHLIIGHY